MRDDNSNLPPPHLLETLRQPRRTQLHDPSVRELFRRWKRLGRPITVDELKVLVDLVVPGEEIYIDQMVEIMGAVEAAGVKLPPAEPFEIKSSADRARRVK